MTHPSRPGSAAAVPDATTVAKPGSVATSHAVGTDDVAPGATRVQSTCAVGVCSPLATPQSNTGSTGVPGAGSVVVGIPGVPGVHEANHDAPATPAAP